MKSMKGILGNETFLVSCIFYFLTTGDTNAAHSLNKTDAEDKPKKSNKQ